MHGRCNQHLRAQVLMGSFKLCLGLIGLRTGPDEHLIPFSLQPHVQGHLLPSSWSPSVLQIILHNPCLQPIKTPPASLNFQDSPSFIQLPRLLQLHSTSSHSPLPGLPPFNLYPITPNHWCSTRLFYSILKVCLSGPWAMPPRGGYSLLL